MTDLITASLVRLDAQVGTDKEETIRALAGIVADAGRATDVDALVRDAMAREQTSSTGLPGGIAIPHCRTSGVDEPVLAFARLATPVDFGAKGGPADLAFLIAAPAGGEATHLELLTKLARALVKRSFTDSLRDARSPEQAVALIAEVVGTAAPASGRPSGAAAADPRATGGTSTTTTQPAARTDDPDPASASPPLQGDDGTVTDPNPDH